MSTIGNLAINVEHVARVEGHGNIVVNVKEGRLEECRLEIVESPRFFEGMLRGRSYTEAQHITCRICGICSVGHTMASLRATEDAFGTEITEQTRLLRRLMLNAEFFQSHILHVYFLVAPDFFGVPSVTPLIETHGEVVARALKLKRFANDIMCIVGGRHIHPISMVPGGCASLPRRDDLHELLQRAIELEADIQATVALFASLAMPPFERPTEYVSLGARDEYPLYDGEIVSSTGETIQRRDYRKKVREYCVAHSHAKHVHGGSGPYMVGALARFNNNHEKLRPKAKAAAEQLALRAPSNNPFHINLAQIVEAVHVWEDSIDILQHFRGEGLKKETIQCIPREGLGVGAVEVPRGILFHEYRYDKDGVMLGANCIIPTGQNLANIERDMQEIVPMALAKGEDGARMTFEMLVRAYDPCISCATHMLNVEFR